MDNPHVQESQLGYLAGIIDGEGTITIERSGNRRLNGITGLQAKVNVANTNWAIIEYVVGILKRLGVNPHIKSQPIGYGTRPRNKQCWWVTVGGLTKTAKVLNVIKPYLVGKRAQADLVLDFINYRGDAQLAKGKPYGPFEANLVEKIRALNFRGTPETERLELSRMYAGAN